jgi:PPE-repeat protein
MATSYTDVVFSNLGQGGITATKLNKLVSDLSSAIASGGGGGTPTSGVLIWGETPAGAINGTNKNFTTANSYAAGQLGVYVNGVRQRRPDDYAETSATTFQLVSAPLVGDILSVDYIKL